MSLNAVEFYMNSILVPPMCAEMNEEDEKGKGKIGL